MAISGFLDLWISGVWLCWPPLDVPYVEIRSQGEAEGRARDLKPRVGKPGSTVKDELGNRGMECLPEPRNRRTDVDPNPCVHVSTSQRTGELDSYMILLIAI